MRIIISLILLSTAFLSYSQRVSFEDPDLTFSFKKPKKWEVFDDGYIVKVSPSVKDSANIYFTITYFEDAKSFGFSPETTPKNTNQSKGFSEMKIDGETAKHVEKLEGNSRLNSYSFMKYGQRFEINTASSTPKSNRTFRKIIRSVRITE